MIIITSGTYLNAEFTSIFGRLPPSFLPVGNRRLYEWQVQSFGDLAETKVLTLPADYIIPDADQATLDRLGVQVLRTPEGLSLGAAIVYVINMRMAVNESVRILHGDTLCGSLEKIGLDVVLSGKTSDHYLWAECETDETGKLRLTEGLPTGPIPRQVLCGYFSFSNGGKLAQCLTAAGYKFVAGLDTYAREYDLTAQDCDGWLDFGHVPTYYRSRAQLTTERAFNRLTTTPLWIRKSSENQSKIEAEAHWFENLPSDLALFTPHYLGREADPGHGMSYRLEYLYLSTLADLAVFGELPAYSWQRIFACIDDFMTRMAANPAPPTVPVTKSADYFDKTMKRLDSFAGKVGLDLSAPTSFAGRALPSLERIAEITCAAIPDTTAADMTIAHGDLCFSNILFDLRSVQIRVIDPRGQGFDGQMSLFGDRRYDLAKLSHSVIGRYDSIIAGRYRLRRDGPLDFDLTLPVKNTTEETQRQFLDMQFAGMSPREDWAHAMMITLFLSMLPLHYDNAARQEALLANALRLFSTFDTK